MTHVWSVSTRKKDGASSNHMSRFYTQDDKSEEEMIEWMHSKAPKDEPYRIYRSVNKRDLSKSKLALVKKILDNLDNPSFNIIGAVSSALMDRSASVTNYILIDLDTKDEFIRADLENLLNNSWYEYRSTKNGYHYIVPRQDTRLFKDLLYLEIKKDAFTLMAWRDK